MKYHKIKTIFNRDPDTKFKTLIKGQFALPEFEYLKDNEWIFTEKVDGMNIRVQYGEALYFGGKTDNAQLPQMLLNELLRLFPDNKMREVFPEPENVTRDICLYGEGFGGKIQKGGKYSQSQSFVLFDVKAYGNWLKRDDVIDIAFKLGIEVVPSVDSGTLEEMVAIAEVGFNSAWGDFEAEGIVARPAIEMLDRMGSRIITKIKCKDFKGEEKK